jgi:rubrerythrin
MSTSAEDAEWQKELQATKKQLADKIKETEKSKEALRRPINRRHWFQLSWRCKKCKERLTKDRGQKETGQCPVCGTIQLFV